MKIPFISLFLSGILLSASASPVIYPRFVESTDAGANEATAAELPFGSEEISGTLKSGATGPFGLDPVDVDVFCFHLSSPVMGASIQVFPVGFDSNLLLLRDGFLGVWGDDNGGIGGAFGNADSGIVTDLPAGTYYIAVGKNDIGAYDAEASTAGEILWGNDTGEVTGGLADTPVAFIGSVSSDPDDTEEDSYTIRFNFTTDEDPEVVERKRAFVAAKKAALEMEKAKAKRKLKRAKKKKKSRSIKKLKRRLKILEHRISSADILY